jgi:hypothetical protein
MQNACERASRMQTRMQGCKQGCKDFPCEGILHPGASNTVNIRVSYIFIKYTFCILDRKNDARMQNPHTRGTLHPCTCKRTYNHPPICAE